MKRVKDWLTVMAVLGACALPLVMWRGEMRLRSWHEGMSLASSQETWRRMQSGEEGAWLLPSVNGEARVVKPPMVVWLNLLAWRGLECDAEGRGPQDEMVSRARLVSAGLGLGAVMGVWVVGRVMASKACGLLGALVMGSFMVGFQKYARMSTYDIALLGFSTMAVAGGVMAIHRGESRIQNIGHRPQHTEDSGKKRSDWARVMMGWVVCAAMGVCAYMSKGPVSLVVVGLGVLPAVVLMGGRRWWVSLMMFGVVSAAMWGSGEWWYGLVEERVANLAETRANEYDGPEWDVRPWWWYLTRVSLVMPWGVVVAGAVGAGVVGVAELARNMSRPSPGRLRRPPSPEGRGIAAMWVWVLGLVVFFSCVGAKVERYVLPALPGLAVVVAELWLGCAKSKRGGAGWWMCVGQWGVCAAMTVGLVVWVSGQEWMAARGWIEKVEVRTPPPGMWVVAGSGMVMAACCAGSWLMLRNGRGLGSGVMIGTWGITAGVLYAGATSGMGGPWEHVRADALAARETVKEASGGVRLLMRDRDDALEPEFVFYAAEVFEKVGVKELRAAVKAGNGPGVVIATKEEKNLELMSGLGYEAVREVRDDAKKVRTMWRRK